jgi:hypothetical protein
MDRDNGGQVMSAQRMARLRVGGFVIASCLALGLIGGASASAETKTFKPEGGSEQAFEVPSGVSQIEVTAIGGAGENACETELGKGFGGSGAKVSATLKVKAGATVYVDFGGGAPQPSHNCGEGGAGGGAADVRTEPGGSAVKSLESRLIVAGGGGGGGAKATTETPGGNGGSATGTTGEAGESGIGAPLGGGTGGGGGTSEKGGAGGKSGELEPGNPGSEGKLGQGGAGGKGAINEPEGFFAVGGGGGGGGYYGGGGGGSGNLAEGGGSSGGGGGAGSSFITSAATAPSFASGKGEPQEVVISYTPVVTQTCGKTTVGIVADYLVANQKRVNKCVLPVNAAISELTEYLSPTTFKGQELIKGIIYADSSGKPGARLGVTEQLTFKSTQTAGWYALKFASPVKVAAGTYWIGVITGNTGKVAGERFDKVANAEDYNTNTYTSGPSNPFGAFKTTSEEMSLYATFTPEVQPCASIGGPLVLC